jgi:hypothetical protein
MIKILHNLALFKSQKRQFFAIFFGENIFLNDNIGPRAVDREIESCHGIGWIIAF